MSMHSRTQNENFKRSLRYAPLTGAAALALTLSGPAMAQEAELPDLDKVQFGIADDGISTSGSTMNVDQNQSRALIDWNSFNVGQGGTVNFNQVDGQGAAVDVPDASWWVVNRVTNAQNPSSISGNINSSHGVVVVSPGGVTINDGAQINVGSFVASSLELDTDAFETSGAFNFSAGEVAGAVTNAAGGSITVAETGLAALVAPTVTNSGLIVARLGKVALAAGDVVAVDPTGSSDSLIMFGTPTQVAEQLENNSAFTATNNGSIEADGGLILMTASNLNALVSSVVNTTGTVQAIYAEEQNGEIVFVGNDVTVSGDINASGGAADPDVEGVVYDPAAGEGGTVTVVTTEVARVDGTFNLLGEDAARNGSVTVAVQPKDIKIVAAEDANATAAAGDRYVVIEDLRAALDNGDVEITTGASATVGPAMVSRVTQVENPAYIAPEFDEVDGEQVEVSPGNGEPEFIEQVDTPSVLTGGSSADITIGQDLIETSGNNLTLTSSKDVNLDALVGLEGDVTLDATGDVNARHMIASGGDVTMKAGGIVRQSGDIYAAGAVNVTAAGGMTLQNSTSINFGASSIFDTTIDGNHVLTLRTGGAALEFKGNIGSREALRSLIISRDGVEIALVERVEEETATVDAISNGDFEDGHSVRDGNRWGLFTTVGAWYSDGGKIEIQKGRHGTPQNPTTNSVVELDSHNDTSHAPVVQDIDLTEGEYTLTFRYAARGGASTNGLSVTITTKNGAVLTEELTGAEIKTATDAAGNDYTEVSYTVDVGVEDFLMSNVDIKDKKSATAIYDTDDVAENGSSSFWIGGGRSNAAELVSEEFAEVTGGSKINVKPHKNENEVAAILNELLSEDVYELPEIDNDLVDGDDVLPVEPEPVLVDAAGLDGVSLVAVSDESFTIEFGSAQGQTEQITFKGEMVAGLIAAAEAENPDVFTDMAGVSRTEEMVIPVGDRDLDTSGTIAFQGAGDRNTIGTLIDDVSLTTDVVTREGVDESVSLKLASVEEAGSVILPGQIIATNGVEIDGVATGSGSVDIQAGTSLTTSDTVTVSGSNSNLSIAAADLDLGGTVTANNISVDLLTSGVSIVGDEIVDPIIIVDGEDDGELEGQRTVSQALRAPEANNLLDDLQADNLTLKGASVSLSGDITYEGDLTLETDGRMSFSDKTAVTAEGLALAANVVTATDEVTLDVSEGTIEIDAESISATTLTLEKTANISGDALSIAVDELSGKGDVSLTSEEGNLTIAGGTTTAAGDLTLSSEEDVAIIADAALSGASVSVDANAVNTRGLSVTATDGEIDIDTASLNTTGNLAFTGDTTVTGDEGLSVSADFINTTGDLELTSGEEGDIDLDAQQVLATGELKLASAGDVNVEGAANLFGASVDIDAANVTGSDNLGLVAQDGNLDVDAERVSADGTLTASATDAINLTGTDEDNRIELDGENIVVRSDNVTINGRARLTSDTFLTSSTEGGAVAVSGGGFELDAINMRQISSVELTRAQQESLLNAIDVSTAGDEVDGEVVDLSDEQIATLFAENFTQSTLSNLTADQRHALGYAMENEAGISPALTLGADAAFTMTEFFKTAPPVRIEGASVAGQALTVNAAETHVHHIGKTTQLASASLNGEQITLGSVYNTEQGLSLTGNITLEENIQVQGGGFVLGSGSTVDTGDYVADLSALDPSTVVLGDDPIDGIIPPGPGPLPPVIPPSPPVPPKPPVDPVPEVVDPTPTPDVNPDDPVEPPVDVVTPTPTPDVNPDPVDPPTDVVDNTPTAPDPVEPVEEPVLASNSVLFDDRQYIGGGGNDDFDPETSSPALGTVWMEVGGETNLDLGSADSIGNIDTFAGEMEIDEEAQEQEIEPVMVRLFGELEEFILVDVIDVQTALPSTDSDDEDRFQTVGCQCD